MQHSDDRPPASGRPSLLSAEQQGEADRQRILSGLDGKPMLSTAGTQKSRSSAVRWVLAGAAVVALSASAGIWLVSEGEKEIVLAGTAPLPATPAPAAPLASEPPAPDTPDEQVSAAVILEDTPVMADKTIVAPVKGAEQIKSMLEKGLPPSAAAPAGTSLVSADARSNAGAQAGMVAAGAVLPMQSYRAANTTPANVPVAKAVARPGRISNAKENSQSTAKLVKTSATKPAATKPASTKPASSKTGAKNAPVSAKSDAKTRAKTPAAAPKKPAAPVKAAANVDSDEALLAALVAHSKATQPKRTSTTAAQLKLCNTLGSAVDAQRCRAQLCAGSAKKEVQCKTSRAAKNAS